MTLASNPMTVVPVHWWQNAVVYQLYVRSFADSNDDGIGDLAGIRSRLEYLGALGVDAIWLNPCYPSPQKDHGYDVADYFDIEPAYGDLDEFDRLVADAKRHGIRILMDVVPNHCSSDHEWFRAALAAGPGSPERERFYFRDGKGPGGAEEPNNWRSIFGGSAWTRVIEPDGSAGQWYLHVFDTSQPDLNWSNPDVVDHFDRMLRFWFDRGVEGFRADAVGVVGKAPGLPDEDVVPGRPLVGTRNPHFVFRPEGFEVWAHWRRLVDDYERTHPGRDLLMVCEAYTPGHPEMARRYANESAFHQIFGFDVLLAPWNAGALRRAIDVTLEAMMPYDLLPAWTLNNHDAQRTVTRYGRADAATFYSGDNLRNSTAAVDITLGTRRARAAALLILALPGCVYLYAGEELGLPEVLDLPASARQDPIFLRTAGHEIGRDGCRVPLPWTADPATSFGFSTHADAAKPWLPQPAGWGQFAAYPQQEDPTATLSIYRAAVAVRKQLAGLRSGSFEWLDVGTDQLLTFARGAVVAACNPTGEDAALPGDVVGSRTVVATSVPGHEDPLLVPHDSTIWLA
jgi:alpha-glucosidase